MSKYKKKASEGSFSASQIKVPDEVPKILQQTTRTVNALKENANFRQRNREIYLRAQQFAQSQEELNRQTNFDLETNNRQQFIDAEERNVKATLRENELKAKAQTKLYDDLADFSKSAFEIGGQIRDKLQKDRVDAANLVVQQAGITADRMQQIYKLDSGLSKAQFNNIEWVQTFLEGDASDDVKQALFTIYENRGSREYTNNVYVLKNQAQTHTSRWLEVKAQLLEENPDLSGQQLIDAYNAFASKDFELVSNYSGKSYTAESLAAHYNPTVASQSRAILSQFQQQRGTEREQQLKDETQRSLKNLFDSQGVVGLNSNLSNLKSRRSRTETLEFLKSNGSIEDIEAFLKLPMSGIEGSPRFEDQFVTEANALKDHVRVLQRRNLDDYRVADANYKLGVETEAALLMEQLSADGQITKDEISQVELIYSQIGAGHSPPEFEKFKAESRWSKASDEMNKILTELSVSGNLSQQYVLSLGLPDEMLRRWLPQAKVLDDFNQSPEKLQVDQQIKSLLRAHPEIKASPEGDFNDSVRNYAEYWTRKRNAEFSRLLSEGTSPVDAKNFATASILKEIESALDRPDAVTDGRFTFADRLNDQRERIQQSIKFNRDGIQYYSTLNPNQRDPSIITPYLNQPRYREYIREMEATGNVPMEVRTHADQMKMSPLDWVNHVAPALDVDPIELKDTTWQQVLENAPPATKALFNVNRTNPRIERGLAILEGRLAEAPVRSSLRQTAEDVPISAFRDQARGQVTFDTNQPGIDVFFEDKQFPAVLSGVVKEVNSQYNSDGSGYGNYIVIESIDPATDEPVDVLYGHLAEPANFSEGDSISEGQIIGIQGGTGSVRSVDGTIASIDFLAPAARGSGSKKPYRYFEALRRRIANDLGFN